MGFDLAKVYEYMYAGKYKSQQRVSESKSVAWAAAQVLGKSTSEKAFNTK